MRADMPVSCPLTAVTRLPSCVIGLSIEERGRIRKIAFLPPETPIGKISDPLATLFCTELQQYLRDPSHVFNLPLSSVGTPFQQRVWSLIRSIPTGQTLHYNDLSLALNSIPRAVGQACGANPFPLVTPCHRVLAKHGLGGFAHASGGWLLETKRWLLRHEDPAFNLS